MPKSCCNFPPSPATGHGAPSFAQMLARSHSHEQDPNKIEDSSWLALEVSMGEALTRNRIKQCIKFEHVQDRATREKLDRKDSALTAWVDYGDNVHDSRGRSSGVLPFHLQVSMLLSSPQTEEYPFSISITIPYDCVQPIHLRISEI